jgi:hypothetical protein
MITAKDPVHAWPMDQEEALRKREGRVVLTTVIVLSVIVGISFYALIQQRQGPPNDLPQTERKTGPAAATP